MLVTTALGTTACSLLSGVAGLQTAGGPRGGVGGSWHRCTTPPAGDVKDSIWSPGVMKMGDDNQSPDDQGKGLTQLVPNKKRSLLRQNLQLASWSVPRRGEQEVN